MAEKRTRKSIQEIKQERYANENKQSEQSSKELSRYEQFLETDRYRKYTLQSDLEDELAEEDRTIKSSQNHHSAGKNDMGSFNSVVNHNTSKGRTSAEYIKAVDNLINTNTYREKLLRNAKYTQSQIMKVKRQQAEMLKQVETAELTGKQIDEISFRVEQNDKKIRMLETKLNNLENKYARETGFDFENKRHTPLAIEQRKYDRLQDRKKEIRSEIANYEYLGTTDEYATEELEVEIFRKKKELAKLDEEIEQASQRVLETQEWQNSKAGQRRLRKFERNERFNKTVDQIEDKLGITDTIKTINRIADKADSIIDKPIHKFNMAVDRLEMKMGLRHEAVSDIADQAYSKVANSVVKKEADKAFSSAGNAVTRSLSGAGKNISNAAKTAAKKVIKMLLAFLKMLFRTPFGYILVGLIVFFIMIPSTPAPGKSDVEVTEEMVNSIYEESFNSEHIYRYYTSSVQSKLVADSTTYRVTFPASSVAALLESSVDPDWFTTKLAKDNYKLMIDDFLKGDKSSIAAKAFIKQVDYHYYYLIRDWEDWIPHAEWLCPDDPDLGKSNPTPEDWVREHYDEVDKVYTWTYVIKEKPDEAACDYRYPVGSPPDLDDYRMLDVQQVYDYYTHQYYWEQVETYDYDAYNRAVREYNRNVDRNNGCHRDPMAYDCKRDEAEYGYHWCWQTRNIKEQHWQLTSDPASVPTGAEDYRDTVTVAVNEDTHGGASSAVSEQDERDRGTWCWFTTLDDGVTWRGNANYYRKKVKFFELWDYKTLCHLLGEEYDIYVNPDAPVQPEEHETFHATGHVIEIYDTEGNPALDPLTNEPITIDLDEFYRNMAVGDYISIFDYDTERYDVTLVVNELTFLDEMMRRWMGNGSTKNLGIVGWPFDPQYFKGFSSCTGIRALCADGNCSHSGDDMLSSYGSQGVGTPVVATIEGTVIYAHDGCTSFNAYPNHHSYAGCEVNTGGNQVDIHGQIYLDDEPEPVWVVITYAHLVNGSVSVNVGQKVSVGDVLGELGSSGASTGPHLHYGIYLSDEAGRKGEIIEPALTFDWSQTSVKPACGVSFSSID